MQRTFCGQRVKDRYERLFIFVMTGIRQALMEAFCPCCVYDRNRHLRLKVIPSTFCKRLFHPGTHEHEMFKHFLGFLGGVLLGIFLYVVMVFQSDIPSVVAMVIGVILSPVISLGLAFSHQVRCVILLMAPQLFSSKGRSFLVIYAVVLVMSHPVTNFNKNVMIMSNSATCGQELSYNQTKEALDQIASPLAGVLGGIRKTLAALKQFAQLMRQAFNSLKIAILEITTLFKKVAEWLMSIAEVCDEKMSQPYRKCLKIFDDAATNCRNTLGWFLSWLCVIVDGVQIVCHVARITELMCLIAGAIKDIVKEHLYTPIRDAVLDVKEMFYFNVTINYTYEYNLTQSKSYSEVKNDILRDINERLSSFTNVISIVKNLMVVSLIFVVIKALIYKKKYQSNDRFDNFYLTFKIRDVEERRLEMGKEGIFPLKANESRKYIKTMSPGMAKREMKAMAKGVFLLLISASHAGFYIMCDYGLYWILDMLKRFFSKKIAAPIPPHLKMHVHGKGAISDMYRALLSSFDPMAEQGGAKLDATKCIPNPSVPNFAVYKEIGAIFFICLLMTIFQAYGLRIRHVIAACYYPKRERERAVWLYNHILKNRGGFLRFARRQMKRQAGTLKEEEKMSIRSRMMSQFPLCRKFFTFLGFKRKYCLCCGNEGRLDDHVNFYHCQTNDCTAVYCLDCFTDINNMCTVCMNPVDYGDFSDVSEERDSSEDEDEILRRKEEAERLRKEREEQQLQKRPSEQMRQMRMQFGITPSAIKAQAETTEFFFSTPGESGAAYDDGYEQDEEFYNDGGQNEAWIDNKDWKPKVEGRTGVQTSKKNVEFENQVETQEKQRSKGLFSVICPCVQKAGPADSTTGSEAETEMSYKYQNMRYTDDEYDDWGYTDDDKSQTDYVTNEIFSDGEDNFIGDYDYPYLEPEELDIDRYIVSKTKV